MPNEIPPSNRPKKKKVRPAPQGGRSARRPAATRRRNPVKTFFACFFLVLFAGLSVLGGYVYHQIHTSKSLPKYIASYLQHNKPVDVFVNQPAMNLMVIGRDYDYNDQDQIIKTKARSDLLMVGRIDFAHNSVSLLSIPRDTRADIPGHGIGKINGAHAHGGPALSEETVRTNFGIPSDHFVALDFQGFEQAIDLLGGVDLAVDKKMDYDDNWGHLHIHLKPGMQHLDGKQAMGFVRFRHSDSDLIRVQRQQALLAALKGKLLEPRTFAKLPAILDTIDRHIDSDLSTDQKVVLAKFIHDVPRDRMHLSTLPSSETNGPFVVTDWPKARPMIHDIFGVDAPDTSGTTAVAHHRRHRHHITRVAANP